MKKKVLSIIMTAIVLITAFSVSISAPALTRPISLDTPVSYSTNGVGDMVMFTFTPKVSGFYSFLSYNVYASEAYLYTKKVVDPTTNEKRLVQLGFSNYSPDYKKYGQSSPLQFCLTHYLEAGENYTYAAGWTDDVESRTMNVKLICESYSEEVIESIEVSCPAELSVYTNGSWRTDSSGKQYYYYDYSRIVTNMTVTVHYTNGTTSSVTGEDIIDGYDIRYLQNQIENHWYPENSPEYTGNILTISILDKSVDYNVKIKNSALYTFKGRVNDMMGKPVSNAVIINNGNTVATTDANGEFSCPMLPGEYRLTASATHSIPREFKVIISVDNESNDFTSKPIRICTCDYITDGYINAKDYSYMIKNNVGTSDRNQLKATINYNKNRYVPLSLN